MKNATVLGPTRSKQVFWVPGGPTEIDYTKGIIDGAAQVGVRNVVYSSFESAIKLTKGKIPLKAMDCKMRKTFFIS